MSTIHEDYIYRIVSQRDVQGRVKSRERNNLEYKESFGLSSWAKYAKTMAAFANNQGGYILFGIPKTKIPVYQRAVHRRYSAPHRPTFHNENYPV